MSDTYILTHDIGTTSNKACLYRITDHIELIASALVDNELYTLPNGGVEQKAEDWWTAVATTTRTVIEDSGIDPADIKGIAFCAQMQGFIAVDKDGNVLRDPMNYLDSRSTAQIEKYLYHGFPRIEGWNARKTLQSLYITGGLATTAKDPLWKYHWVRDNEPDIFAQMDKWLDIKDFFILRCTGKATTGYDSAHLSFIYDTRPGKLGWHKGLCDMFDVDMSHLPPVVASTDIVGHLTSEAAKALGLVEGIPVFGGGGDASLIPIGAGCLDLHDTHIYIGTSGWVTSTVDKRMTDIGGLIAAVLGAIPDWYNYVAVQETSGRCLQWVRDHLAEDEIGLYLGTYSFTEADSQVDSLYEYMNQEIEKVSAGSGGVIFTPWLHGNRSPFEDPYVRGMFFNIGLETGKREMIRAVLEGVAYHKRWMLERVEKKIPRQEILRFVGGGARSNVWAQILADVTGRTIEVMENAQNAGTVGAAVACAVGLGLMNSFQEAKALVRVEKVFTPNPQHKVIYDQQFAVFTELYKNNRKLYKTLNKTDG